ncbi:hypothetical protein [Clavibacter michiganensis]|uniref:hypothetical protein n=1 Tax=Clavibacter michiganensis TaxID=28447 RepID=UPI001431CAEB|nr:hypothetical protein [Clavibacter michiganensis]MDO4144115.1 hypothetical protein [Clavibacter michiganensis]QIT13031.1 hypothetical protein GRD74_15715 [Clavibacter michiganensis subsp. michiganensis]QIT16226.1 hypothetical protein GRD61_16095 [Clavibacter michiganensis subsp. michiganensis]
MSVARELWDTAGEIGKRSAAVFTVHKLDVPRTVDDLVQVVSQISGKPVLIERLGDERWERLTALWLSYPEQDVVLVRSTDSPLYQTHCVLHELAHIVYAHPGCADFATPEDVSAFVRDGCTVRGRRLEPDTARVTTRHDTFEGEAESLARLLGRSLLRPRYLADEQAFG